MTPPKVTKEGRALLFKALLAIKKHPRSFSMMTTLMRHRLSVRPTGKTPEPYCGTVACIAGHIVLAAGATPEKYFYRDDDETLPPAIRKAAQRAPYGSASVQELATRLLVGRWADGQVDRLFHDFTITRNNVDHAVRYWLRTGNLMPKKRARR